MPTQPSDEARKIQNRLANRVADLRRRRDISNEGRRRQIAKAKDEADNAMRKHRTENEAARQRREETLLRRLFGNATASDATAVVSFRDAQDRAERLTKPDEAAELLARARRSGDNLLAKAVGMRALDQARSALPGASDQWATVLDRWAQDEPPAVDEALTELGAMHRANSSPNRAMESATYTIATPAELRGHNVALLARQADKDDAA